MRDFICPDEWEQMKALENVIDFGNVDSFDCEILPPMNAGEPPMCISVLDGGTCSTQSPHELVVYVYDEIGLGVGLLSITTPVLRYLLLCRNDSTFVIIR